MPRIGTPVDGFIALELGDNTLLLIILYVLADIGSSIPRNITVVSEYPKLATTLRVEI
jgi:hypothetical protein